MIHDTTVSDGGNSAPLAGPDSADSLGHSHAVDSEPTSVMLIPTYNIITIVIMFQTTGS